MSFKNLKTGFPGITISFLPCPYSRCGSYKSRVFEFCIPRTRPWSRSFFIRRRRCLSYRVRICGRQQWGLQISCARQSLCARQGLSVTWGQQSPAAQSQVLLKLVVSWADDLFSRSWLLWVISSSCCRDLFFSSLEGVGKDKAVRSAVLTCAWSMSPPLCSEQRADPPPSMERD